MIRENRFSIFYNPANSLLRHGMPLKSFIDRPVNYLKKTHSFPLIRLAFLRSIRFFAISWVFLVVSNAQAQDLGDAIRPEGLSQDQIFEGWISLFDGETTFGWTPVTKANWEAKGGTIEVSDGERGLLRTTSQFDDFEMTLEFKADPGTNSGIFLRTSPTPGDVTRDCYELNIAPGDHPFPTGSFVGRIKSDTRHEKDRWHHFRILMDGPKIKVWLDDEKTIDFVDPNPIGRGYIGLQLNSGKVAFRNIFLKPLNQDALFDGSDLDEWKIDQKLDSEFKVTDDGELQILGGRGQIESKKQYGDFIFSTMVKTNAKGLNSGLFYRCIPGDLMNGYESQIQNQFKDGNRKDPVDCGTGGIFRRTDARYVNANDREWFSKTIVATGPHVSVWVNGYQVTDWTDKRKPNENPRKGLRVEKGTLIFQGHDPTTDILIKNVLAKEIAPRRPKK